MPQKIDLETWNRKPTFEFFSKFEEPFFGASFTVKCTRAYNYTKQNEQSFFLYYVYRALIAANNIENFKYRIVNGEVYLYEINHASPTINRANGTFGFAYFNFMENEQRFIEAANQEIEEVRQTNTLLPAVSGENVIHFSAMPWLSFTSVSHARCFSFQDSCPKICFGKILEHEGEYSMPVSVHVHHALADGYHVAQFAQKIEELLNS